MYMVVSSDPRTPFDLTQGGFQIEKWSPDEFITKASSDDGIDPDEGIWYDVSDLTAEIYEGLMAYADSGVKLVYYRYDDRPAPNFTITSAVKLYSSTADTPATNDSEPVVEQSIPTAPVQPEPVMEQPMSATPYVQPTPMEQQTEQTGPMETSVYPQAPIQPQSIPQHVVEPSIPPQQVYPQTPLQSNVPVMPTPMQVQPHVVQQPFENQPMQNAINNMLQFDDFDIGDRSKNRKAAPAKVILFGSSKGGTGKTCTCLFSAYWYAKNHPTEKIALADFDIIDGQVGITINKLTPTMQDYYKLYINNRRDFISLENNKVKSDHFSPNIDFYLAPSQDIPTITNNNEFWNDIFDKLIKNYDVVFFDSGIDYIGKLPISNLYKIADKVIITCNPSINAVKSVIKQFKTLSGQRQNNIFRPGDDILKKTGIVLTRIDKSDDSINRIVEENIKKYVPIIAEFGQIDKDISQIQWYQQWLTIDTNTAITQQLDKIIAF